MDVLEAKIDALHKELQDKHSQNRKDIHDLRSVQQALTNQQRIIELRLVPVLGNEGKPGLIEKVDSMIEAMTEMRIAIATRGGAADLVWRLVPILISLCSLALMFWMVLHK